jgi:hypothetical protein
MPQRGPRAMSIGSNRREQIICCGCRQAAGIVLAPIYMMQNVDGKLAPCEFTILEFFAYMLPSKIQRRPH